MRFCRILLELGGRVLLQGEEPRAQGLLRQGMCSSAQCAFLDRKKSNLERDRRQPVDSEWPTRPPAVIQGYVAAWMRGKELTAPRRAA